MEIRRIEEAELAAARKVQSIAFNFGTDFSKETEADYRNYLAVFDDAGKLCACLETLPFEARFNGSTIKMAGIGGVASLPEERKKGYVRMLFQRMFEIAHEEGTPVSYLYPFSHPFYRKFGYECCTSCVNVTIPLTAFRRFTETGTVVQYFPGENPDEIRGIYSRFSENRNLMISRKEDTWKKKLSKDPFKNNRYIYLWRDSQGKAQSYVIFEARGSFQPDMQVEELIWATPESLRGIFAFLKSFASNYGNFIWTAPSFLNFRLLFDEPYEVKAEEKGLGMCRAVDAQGLLSAMKPAGAGEFTAEIQDFLPWNNGQYKITWENGKVEVRSFCGRPDLIVGASSLIQLVAGYAVSRELCNYGKISIEAHPDSVEAFFKKREAFICDGF